MNSTEPEPGELARQPNCLALIIHAVALLLVISHVVAVSRQKEYWPVSHYPMYARKAEGTRWSQTVFVGITWNEQEYPLDIRRHLTPFDPSRLHLAMRRMDSPEQLDQARSWLLERYQLLRRRGEHGGPDLREIHIYRDYWSLDGDPDKASPMRRELIDRIAPTE